MNRKAATGWRATSRLSAEWGAGCSNVIGVVMINLDSKKSFAIGNGPSKCQIVGAGLCRHSTFENRHHVWLRTIANQGEDPPGPASGLHKDKDSG